MQIEVANELYVEEIEPEIRAEELGPLRVEGYSPIYYNVRWRNNKLRHGAPVRVIVVLGEIRGNRFAILTIKHHGVDYGLASFADASAPRPGSEATTRVNTYAYNFAREVTLDAAVAITPREGFRYLTANWGKGERCVAIELSRLYDLLRKAYGDRWFDNVLTVYPWRPHAEITGFSVHLG